MAKMKLGINGMGRIGRTVLRELTRRNTTELEVVAVNNPGSIDEYIHLLQWDSVHGPFKGEIKRTEKGFSINGKDIQFSTEKDPKQIGWSNHGIDLVIDATGVFKDKPGLGQHLGGSVKKVIMCAPGKDLDNTIVMGINHETYDSANHHIVSNASCTTNCLAPVCKVLHDSFGIESGFMTTVHAYTSDQMLLDGSHSDLRRARAAALSMVPTTTGAAKSVGEVIPSLKGKLDGYAVRVPTPNVSMVDLTATLAKSVTASEVNEAIKKASEGSLKGVLKIETLPLVSADFNGMTESSCVDAQLTNVIGGTNLKIVAWYDNEVGFSNRVIDLAHYMLSR
jgi:glyceraldehyde 3-phosphate dehydrogenase